MGIKDWLYVVFGGMSDPSPTTVKYIPKDTYITLLKSYNHLKEQLEEVDMARIQREANRKDLAKGCKLQIYRDENKEFRWRLKARNHKIIAESGEGYKRRAGLDKALTLIMQIIEVVEVEEN